jgi:hypothetical protein
MGGRYPPAWEIIIPPHAGYPRSRFNGQPGTTARAVNVSGIGPATAVSGSTTPTVTYKAFAILYAPGSAPPPATPAPPAFWLALAGLGSGGAATRLRSRLRTR